MDLNRTTAAIQEYLDGLARVDSPAPAEPVVRQLLGRAAGRLHQLCATLLFRSYPRLTKPPLNLQTEELLSGVTERLIRAMRTARPGNVRQFFHIANQHIRWELNDLAARLDNGPRVAEMGEQVPAAPESSASQLSPIARRIFRCIDELPDEEREVFELVRIQGLTHLETAELMGVSPKTVQRRLNRGLLLLTQQLGDLCPRPCPPVTD